MGIILIDGEAPLQEEGEVEEFKFDPNHMIEFDIKAEGSFTPPPALEEDHKNQIIDKAR